MTELPLWPERDIPGGLFASGRSFVRTHPLATDALVMAGLLALSSVWLAGSGFASPKAVIVQTVLVAVVAVRRRWPAAVFLAASAIAFGQWLLGFPLLGDAALLVGLYTVAAHQSRIRAVAAAGLLEAGAVLAAVKWEPAGTPERSLLFLTATVIAALFTGLTAASGSRYLAWMDERARRLELERDQQAELAAAAERTRIARELHDIVSHSLSVVITLADAAAIVSRADPGQGAEAMTEVSEVGRGALADMRAMLGVLRTDTPASALAPQPGVAELDALVDRVRATGLDTDLTVAGTPFPLGRAAELTVFRIVQEALTNALRHAGARHAQVTIGYDHPEVRVRITDDGPGAGPEPGPRHPGHGQPGSGQPGPGQPGPGQPGPCQAGHGLDGMRERVALHGGTLSAGPDPYGGWLVEAIFAPERASP